MIKIGNAIKNSLTRKSINLVIQNFENTSLVFKSSTFSDTIKKIEECQIDFLIIDNDLITDIYYVLNKLQSIKPECKIILFINHIKKKSIFSRKIYGVIHQNINSSQLEHILNKEIEDNETFINKTEGENEIDYNPEKNYSLTKREIQILKKLLNQKTSTKNIAKSLNISINTVNNHLNNLFKKLSVHNKIQAITEALKKDLVKFSS